MADASDSTYGWREIYERGANGETIEGIVPDVTGPLPRNVAGLAEATIEYYLSHKPTDEIVTHRKSLTEIIRKFHTDAGTFTPAVKEALSKLADRDTLLIRAGHQPNLFPYTNVFLQFVLLNLLRIEIARRLPSVPIVALFFVVDTDVISDEWFRRSYIPCVQCRDGYLRLELPGIKQSRFKIISQSSLLDLVVISQYSERVKTHFNQDLAFLRKRGVNACPEISANIDALGNLLNESFLKSSLTGNTNAYFMSSVVNKSWEHPTLFLRNSDMEPLLAASYEAILRPITRYNESIIRAQQYLLNKKINLRNYKQLYASDKFPLWYACPNDFSRIPMAFKAVDSTVLISGECLSCGHKVQESLGQLGSLTLGDIKNRMSARVILRILSLSPWLGLCCQVGHIGAAEYMLVARLVANWFDIALPPIFLWKSNWVYLGLDQLRTVIELAEAGLIQEEPTSSSTLTPLLAILQGGKLKTQTEKLAQRASKALSLAYKGRASILDFAGNYGIATAEQIWSRMLNNSDRIVSEHIVSNNIFDLPKERFDSYLLLLKRIKNIAEPYENNNYVDDNPDEDNDI